MALFISEQRANLFQSKVITAKNGNEFVACDVVFYSKKADKDGNYTQDDTPFRVKGISFSKTVVDFVKDNELENLYVELNGKLTTEQRADTEEYFSQLLITKIANVAHTKQDN